MDAKASYTIDYYMNKRGCTSLVKKSPLVLQFLRAHARYFIAVRKAEEKLNERLEKILKDSYNPEEIKR